MTSRRVLITGANGFIGRHLLPLLVGQGWEIHASSIDDVTEEIPGVAWHQANLLVPGEARRLLAATKPSTLMHLAWFVAPGQWAAAPDNLDWVRASLELAREFVGEGGTRMVVSGSCLEYDWNYGYCSEARTPCNPHTLYGAAKNALRLALEAFASQAGCSLAWGRVFFLYGPYEHPDRLVAHVARSLLRGEPARCSHGRQIRDYLYVGDVARAFAALLESDIRGPVNIASGQPISLRTLVERLGDLIGRRDLLQLGAIPAAPTDKPLVIGDISRLSVDLGWAPSFSLDEGLTLTIEWWRRQISKDGSGSQ
jgi:nucleoside-diphosphate-sugar epimerase